MQSFLFLSYLCPQQALAVFTHYHWFKQDPLQQQQSLAMMQTANELQRMKQALTRSAASEYHKLDPLGHGRELQALQDHRARKREDFSNQFLSLLHQHEMVKHSSAFLTVCSSHVDMLQLGRPSLHQCK